MSEKNREEQADLIPLSGERVPFCGIVNLDKGLHLTSQTAVSKVRRLCGGVKAGHTGTLDPDATGVLPILLGRATVFAEYVLEKDKCYEAVGQLGVTTDTEDMTGTVLAERDASAITGEQVEEALCAFRGEILQIPPMYSALKRDGKKLCDLAREGITIEREPRPVTIYSLELKGFDEEKKQFSLAVTCSRGTYIRTLIADIGAALSCGAALASLRRTEAGPFTLASAHTLEELEQAAKKEELPSMILPVESLFLHLPSLSFDPFFTRLLKNGLAVKQKKLGCKLLKGERATLYEEGKFLGLLESVEDEEELCMKMIKHLVV